MRNLSDVAKNLIGMGTVLLFVFSVSIHEMAQAAGPGKIVASGDEWTLSDPGFSKAPDAGTYALNVANWFTGGSPGNFLAFARNFCLTGSQLAATMTGAGHSWTVDSNVDFTLPNLLQYDAIFVCGSLPPDNQVLINYVNAGGNVYLGGGTGDFATVALPSNPRWRSGSIYLFGLDTHGNMLFSGDPFSRSASELNSALNETFGKRDAVSVADAFGETFLYYSSRDPSTGMLLRKVAFVKRVVSHRVPILVGSGFYLGGSAAAVCETARQTLADLPATRVNYGFYTDFNPVSYSDARVPGFGHRPMGYEPDLVAAIEIFSRGRLTFNAMGIGNPFSGIWLKAAQEPYDMVGGGITALPERTRDADGQPVIRFGVGHIRFSQSLLVRSTSVIQRHDDLSAAHRVGVLRGTTGERRLLELTGIIDAAGFLRSGTRVQLASGAVEVAGAPGSAGALRIAAGTGSAAIATRVRLTPPGDDRPEVFYFDSDGEQINALLEGKVDAVARGEVGNRIASRDTPGLRVTTVDAAGNEQGAFSYPDTSAGNALRVAMNAAVGCLIANGTVGFAQWLASDGAVFSRRARELR